ncbi:MAG: hypothetical protein WKF94_16855 [Solirubrobacteraceae bacterium]
MLGDRSAQLASAWIAATESQSFRADPVTELELGEDAFEFPHRERRGQVERDAVQGGDRHAAQMTSLAVGQFQPVPLDAVEWPMIVADGDVDDRRAPREHARPPPRRLRAEAGSGAARQDRRRVPGRERHQ